MEIVEWFYRRRVFINVIDCNVLCDNSLAGNVYGLRFSGRELDLDHEPQISEMENIVM